MDPKKKIREMFFKAGFQYRNSGDTEVSKYAERIRKTFPGVKDELAEEMAKRLVLRHVR